ncbi:MAG TPA: hypothetical protein VLF20_04215, partial [Patescibacteria group bacterium]|nr:hypothetical protein [Patescibacteria group bacterium]
DTTISIDYLLIGPGTPVIEGTGPWTIFLPILSLPANDGKILVNYGGGTPLDGVTNHSTSGVTQFNTKVKMTTQSSQKFVSLPKQPTITLLPSPRDNPFNSIWISPEKRTPFSF